MELFTLDYITLHCVDTLFPYLGCINHFCTNSTHIHVPQTESGRRWGSVVYTKPCLPLQRLISVWHHHPYTINNWLPVCFFTFCTCPDEATVVAKRWQLKFVNPKWRSSLPYNDLQAYSYKTVLFQLETLQSRPRNAPTITVEACVARYGRHYLLTYALH